MTSLNVTEWEIVRDALTFYAESMENGVGDWRVVVAKEARDLHSKIEEDVT